MVGAGIGMARRLSEAMLGYLSRTLPVILGALARRAEPRVSTLYRRVHPGQLDLNGHMNQACYAQVMELGRTDWLLGNGAWSMWRAAQIHPVVGEQRIIYRRELRLGQRFGVDSRVVDVEGRLMMFENVLFRGDVVHAVGTVGLLFIGPDGVLGRDAVERLAEPWRCDPVKLDQWRIMSRVPNQPA